LNNYSNEVKQSILKTPNYIRSKTTWQWTIIGGLTGFFVIHPFVMIASHLMFQPRIESNYSIAAIIFAEFTRVFSFQMLPWGLSLFIISAISGFFYGRGRQAVDALRKSEQRFRELSITDDLTGLFNSRHFFDRLKAEVERTNRYGHPLSLLILDLDNFKKYNDTFGHIAGDEVLEKAGEILHRSLRKTDSAYRYGGEEFAIILPETGGRKALHFAERLRANFENQAFAARQEEHFSVTVSIGVAQYTAEEEIAPFIKQADDNMYTAKKKGKNRIYSSV
jgi:diguanylate cyclase (GGDEF)-like protein